MKRILISILLLGLGFAGLAQNTPYREIKANQGDVYAKMQECYTPSFDVDGSKGKVRNVILLIGDGMGMGAVNAAMYANGGELTMTNLRTFGYVRTQSADNFTTDSAASGTAFACGVKTNNGYVGVGTDGEDLENLPEKLAKLGYISGVVSSDELNGATPASFFAHEQARGNSTAIWADLPESVLSFASAGSQATFEKQSLKTREAIEEKFELVYSPEDEDIAESDRLLYLPETVSAERGDYLPKTTEMAIEYLDARARKGFFLMVEGARIDKEEHANNLKGTVAETLDFDKAVEAAVRFAEEDGHTLVLITADHETGALSLTRGNPADGYAVGVFASKGHSPMMVPLFAYGPKSFFFTGTQENTEVSNKIYSILAGEKIDF